MTRLALAAILLLAACATPAAQPRVGAPVDIRAPQAAEQCRAQPDLDWCAR